MKKIVITPEMMEACVLARKGWYNPCPLTMALRQRFPNDVVLANGTGIRAGGKHFRMPPRIMEFITAWDKYQPVLMEPISFWLFQKNRPWKRFAIWFNKLPFVISTKNKVWYPLKGLTRNIWPVRMCRVAKRKIDRYEQIKQRALIPLQVGAVPPAIKI